MSKWTNKTPDEIGVYWLREPDYPKPFLVALAKKTNVSGNVTMICEHVLLNSAVDRGWSFDPYDSSDKDHLDEAALWYGPLKPPELT